MNCRIHSGLLRIGKNIALFLSDARGNFAPIIAICAVPLMLVIGSAVDYTLALQSKTQIQEMADAAALSGVTAGLTGASHRQREKIASKWFDANCDETVCNLITNISAKSSGDIVEVSVKVDSPLEIMSKFGVSKFPMTIVAAATAQAGTERNMEVYLVADKTGSMNIADGALEIATMRANFNPYSHRDGCAFACHTDKGDDGVDATFNGKTGFEVSRDLGIYLREDRIRDEMTRFGKTILTSAGINAKVALIEQTWGTEELTKPVKAFGQLKKYLKKMENESGGTNLSFAFGELKDEIPASGDGSKKNPEVYVVMITDGVTQNDSGDYVLLDPSVCDPVKSKGVTLRV